MLEKVTDKNMLSQIIIKHIKKNVSTNCLLYTQEHEIEINANSLFIKEYPSDNMFLIKMRDNFAILYFYINDSSAFFDDMKDIKLELKGKKIVTEIAYKEGQNIDDMVNLFLNAGFKKSINRVCLEKNNKGFTDELKLPDGIHLQSELINENGVLNFIKENFDELTGCVPLISMIRRRI